MPICDPTSYTNMRSTSIQLVYTSAIACTPSSSYTADSSSSTAAVRYGVHRVYLVRDDILEVQAVYRPCTLYVHSSSTQHRASTRVLVVRTSTSKINSESFRRLTDRGKRIAVVSFAWDKSVTYDKKKKTEKNRAVERSRKLIHSTVR